MTKAKIKSRVYEAYAIAQHIYQENKTAKSDHAIQQMIIDAISPIRFEKETGYYFISRFNGVAILFPSKPESEGVNLMDVRDTHGQYVTKDMIKIVKQSGEGFYEYQWIKPHAAGNDFKKISFVKRLGIYDWFIGTGLYVDDVEDQIKADLLSTISRIRFEKEGYIFINRLNGDALVSNGKLFSGDKKLWEVFDKNPEKMKTIFEKEYNAALKPEGDYIYYSHIKLTDPNKESPKVSFIYGIPELQWLVGAGVYLDDVETVIARMQTELNNQTKMKMLYFTLIVSGIVTFFLFLFSRLNHRIKNDFSLFISFLSRAALFNEPIDRDKVQFDELDRMAENANRMIADRRQAEMALKESEERFKDLFESANDLIQIVDAEGKFVYVNRKWRELLGFTDNETRQEKFTTIVRKDQIPHCTEVFKKVVNGESIEQMETIFVSKDGREIYVEGSLNPSFKIGEFVSCRGIFRDITERKKAEELEHERTDQIILNKAALLELTTMHPQELEAFYKIITIISSQVLGVERVSIWMFDSLHNEIICEALYTLSKHSHEKGLRLQVQKYPQYFKAIEENTIVAEDDASTDPRTNEFTEQYLKPLGILSMMDIPIRRQGKVIGILCFGHTEPRQWTYEDQNFATAVAQIIRSSLEDFDRNKAEDALRDNEEDLQKRVKDLEDFYAMAVGRELRMKELKELINELKKRLGKYETVDD